MTTSVRSFAPTKSWKILVEGFDFGGRRNGCGMLWLLGAAERVLCCLLLLWSSLACRQCLDSRQNAYRMIYITLSVSDFEEVNHIHIASSLRVYARPVPLDSCDRHSLQPCGLCVLYLKPRWKPCWLISAIPLLSLRFRYRKDTISIDISICPLVNIVDDLWRIQ